jgi:hypothetical protein
MASLGVIAATALKAVGKETNTSLLRSLKNSSENLTRISETFAKLLANREIKVHSFLEERSITSIAGVGKVRGGPPLVMESVETKGATGCGGKFRAFKRCL